MEINITYSQDRFFKVLTKDAKSAHGGKFDWTPYLPKFDKDRNLWMPGEWTPKVDPSICHTGYHLTSDPLRWFIKEGRLFLCEYQGEVSSDNSDKTAFESVRMLRECGKDDLNIKARLFVKLASGADLSGAYIDRDPCISGWKFESGQLWKAD